MASFSDPSRQRPPGGQSINHGPETVPRQAATVIVLRGGAERLEVLLVKRTEESRFMAGAWVFPGGAVDRADAMSADDDDDRAHRVAAVRELHEEAGLVIDDPASLVKFSRWITPAEVTIRFDTHFYLVPMPGGQEPVVDGQECVDARWFAPADALRAHAEGEILLVFPTIKHLEQLGQFASADALLDHARGRTVVAVQPRMLLVGEVARVVLPGEPGYDE
ncbi:MAG TPA: NUDIX hydrolase [Solirubrobacteraceae bacterium]|jgi:8-oxo-dGTP pyrophosphatase MutT (NUDIX family)|nr:NUDIX hydrolase [Solirubrobacteraceae bacterium]